MLAAATETRETFANLDTWQIVLWYVLIVVSTAIFFWGAVQLVLKYRRGRGAFKVDEPKRRLQRVSRGRRHPLVDPPARPAAGLGHLLIFYGFLVLFIGTAILAFQDDFAEPVLGFDFFEGWFYLGYSLFLDVFGAALIVGLAIMAVKRGVLRPFRLDYWRPDRAEGEYDRRPYVIGDWLFLGILFFLALTGFLLESFRIAELEPRLRDVVAARLARRPGLPDLGLTGDAAQSAHFAQWWVHGVVALAFVASIPFTKAVHMLDRAGRRRPSGRHGRQDAPAAPAEREARGGRLRDHRRPRRWKHLSTSTPARSAASATPPAPRPNSGYPLSPRDLVLDLRE